ncbi:glycosyltransferase family 9 protein [Lacihabitans soyangensis]|uniref:Lipopolysaccharide heptosyltransferase family protein n=1 Tax=Lacihabitans soyangensis TaxID=869394 RepID=A0AAE3KWK0_9BACT|nr:glycosyltransferase family 9 protein [Lacihabitans soyangensis]MCP9765846.1 lipopolysaccharide heptosyltransferase family protein [Lacihabitans soyangensis]
MKKIIIFRFSAMGDVALLLPVVLNAIIRNPDLKITIVTREKFKVFFDCNPNIDVFIADFDKKHKGFFGLFKLFQELNNLSPDFVFDLHQNIRTQVLKFFFLFTRAKIFGFDKGRNEKKKLVKNQEFKQLSHVTERYYTVFKEAKLVPKNSKIENLPEFFKFPSETEKKIENWLVKFKGRRLVGIAPFAQHKGKIWPIENYSSLIVLLSKEFPECQIVLFGGGKQEKEILESLKNELPQIENLVGVFSLKEELALINRLDLMICGDSSNMHFAALSNIPVLSIWGSTHSFAGFGALFQPETNTIEISKEELSCRPCSVYGNKPCYRKDYACLNWISPELVYEKTKTILTNLS